MKPAVLLIHLCYIGVPLFADTFCELSAKKLTKLQRYIFYRQIFHIYLSNSLLSLNKLNLTQHDELGFFKYFDTRTGRYTYTII